MTLGDVHGAKWHSDRCTQSQAPIEEPRIGNAFTVFNVTTKTRGYVLILITERFDRRKEPTDKGVRRAEDLHRQYYGKEAFRVIDNRMLAASFSPDKRHRVLLKQVSAELLAAVLTNGDRAHAIEPRAGRSV